ncbi:myosin light chain kinase, smooth muscle-like [Brachionichthys hirsutus]|uniref:myosin light chain kinase, smooth muscle-like n=1 Tax=Brachionichthys hirsutus TaxID=412623 RepID=UPI003604C76A
MGRQERVCGASGGPGGGGANTRPLPGGRHYEHHRGCVKPNPPASSYIQPGRRLHSRMDQDGRKTFVSTFQLVLKPRARRVRVARHAGDGRETSSQTLTGRNAGATDPGPPLQTPRFNQPISATFQGVITGSPPLSVSWQHNGKRQRSGRASFGNGLASPTVTRRSPGDAGMSTCTAESRSAALHGAARKEIPRKHEVTVKVTSPAPKDDDARLNPKVPSSTVKRSRPSAGAPVEFVDPPEQVEVRVGEEARLHCEFRSSSLPVASCWIYNRDQVVVGGERTSIRSSDTRSCLVVCRACPADTGSYTVVVRNRRGSARHTVGLAVVDRPDPPASQPAVSKLSTTSLVLSWTGPSYDGGAAVLGYVVEVKREGPDGPGIWTELASRCKNTSHHLRSGLEPLGQYRFRIRAYNSGGVSEASRESDCVKMATGGARTDPAVSYVTVTIDTERKVGEHYAVLDRLGGGKFGEVFRLSHKETGQECAGKFYRARTSKERKAARAEMELMNCLRHPRLVQCLAGYDSRTETVMVMEYIAGGELFERLVDDSFEHTEPTSGRYMQQILEGMEYVHRQNIVHLDLKPENIVCTDPTGTRIKIIDFGLARKLETGKPLMVMHGTPEFVAPEVIGFEPLGLETDMWSIGVICFILLSGESPFQGNSDAETLALVTAACYEFDQESFEDISDEAKDFISSLLKKDCRCRLSCTEALAHPWMVSLAPLSRRTTKSLNKGRMRRFLAKRKWKKTGKAVLALRRMANLSSRPDSPGTPSEEPAWSPEAEQAIQSLDTQLQSGPSFQQVLRDAALPRGATARFTCLVNGYPAPEVAWLKNEEPLSESNRVTMEQLEGGACSLILTGVEPLDSGVYACRATNRLGAVACAATLRVEM